MSVQIDTGRMILRHFTADDVEAMLAMNNHPEVIRYVGNKPMTSLDEARRALENGPLRDYATRGFGRFAVVWKATGEVIGFNGVKFIAELGQVELGYRLLRPYWGMGLATEGALASIEYARDVLQLERLIGLVHPDNSASANVMRKMGFALTGRTRFALIEDTDVDLYAREL